MATMSITVERKDEDTAAAETAIAEALETLLPVLERMGKAYEATHPGHSIRVGTRGPFVELTQKRSGRVWSSCSQGIFVDVLRDGCEVTAQNYWHEEGCPQGRRVMEPIADADWEEVKQLCGQRLPLGACIGDQITVDAYGQFRYRDRLQETQSTVDLVTGEVLPSESW